MIRSLFGRRQFLILSICSALTLIFRRFSKIIRKVFKTDTGHAADKTHAVSAEALEGNKLKGMVAYYSATGNTGKIAGAIFNGLKTAIECDVAPIKKIDPKDMMKYDVIAIGGPVWHFRETANLRLFVYNMPQLTGKQIVLYCTHGPNPDRMFYQLELAFRRKGAVVIGWNDWYGGSLINLHSPSPAPTDGHPDEIDLKEAETFGREMAERAKRIYSGEKKLIPDIPTGADADRLWISNRGDDETGMMAMQDSSSPPIIDLESCVYPRCSACVDNCVANAIDLSAAAPAERISKSPILIKGCVHCGLCVRSCRFDAIEYEQNRLNHAIDMGKCIYPKCTLCIDHCPMDCIDFSKNPPVFHNNCEGCDVCFALCPTRAVEITNFAETHGRMGDHSGDIDPHVYKGFYSSLNEAKEKGKFRPHVTISEIGFDTPLSSFVEERIPFFVRNEEDFPYHLE
jgi:ferredoxin